MIRLALTVAIIATLIWSCGPPKDDDPTAVIMSAYNESTFSLRMFELKVDSTFRYQRLLDLEDFDTHGSWKAVSDTFVLFSSSDPNHTYGRIVAQDPQPLFLWDASDSALFDMTNPNCRLVHHDPPKNVDFKVNR